MDHGLDRMVDPNLVEVKVCVTIYYNLRRAKKGHFLKRNGKIMTSRLSKYCVSDEESYNETMHHITNINSYYC